MAGKFDFQIQEILNRVFDADNNRLIVLPRLANDEYMVGRNAADSADINIIKVTTENKIGMGADLAFQQAATISTTTGALTLAPNSVVDINPSKDSNHQFKFQKESSVHSNLSVNAFSTGGTIFMDWSVDGGDVDYDFRLRRATGANGALEFTNRGTGAIELGPNNRASVWSFLGTSATLQAPVGATIATSSGNLTLNPAGSVTISKNVEISDATNIQLGTTTGTKIGTATTQKLGFWNATPVVQATGIADADGTLADITTKFNSLLGKLETYGLLAVA